MFIRSHFFKWRILIIKDLQTNESIRDPQVRLIDDQGTQLGVVSIQEAMSIASNKKLDLVKINPNSNPPVCKVMNYGKFKYEQSKKEQESRKKQKAKMVELKGMRLSLGIGDHDLKFKANTVMKFLKDGNKVRISLRLRGRENAYKAQAIETVTRFAEMVSEHGSMDERPKISGYMINAMIEPKIKK